MKQESNDDAAEQAAKDKGSCEAPDEVRQEGAAADAAAGTVDATAARGLLRPWCRSPDCEYQVTWYEEKFFCCKKCEESPGEHGKRCDRQLHPSEQ